MSHAHAPVLIVGAGPSGLATAASLQSEGIAYELVDLHGAAGGAYARAYGAMELASPARFNALPGLALAHRGEYMTVAEYASYLSGYAAHHRIGVRRERVRHIDRGRAEFSASFEGREAPSEYRCVVVATGMFDFPRMPEIPGLDATSMPVMHVARWPGAEAFRGRRLLIAGAATSAVEIAEECAGNGIAVTMAARRRRVKRLPQRVLGRDIHDYLSKLEGLPRFVMRSYCAGRESLPASARRFGEMRRKGLIDVRHAIARIDGQNVFFVDGGEAPFDALVCATGYRYPVDFLPGDVARAPLSGQPLADAGESCSWPGLYVVGMPCSRSLASPFLRGIARDAPAVARRIVRRLAQPRP
jgi:putative flavoprotein involved in K+ transport